MPLWPSSCSTEPPSLSAFRGTSTGHHLNISLVLRQCACLQEVLGTSVYGQGSVFVEHLGLELRVAVSCSAMRHVLKQLQQRKRKVNAYKKLKTALEQHYMHVIRALYVTGKFILTVGHAQHWKRLRLTRHCILSSWYGCFGAQRWSVVTCARILLVRDYAVKTIIPWVQQLLHLKEQHLSISLPKVLLFSVSRKQSGTAT